MGVIARAIPGACMVLLLVSGCGKPAATTATVTKGDMVLVPAGPFAMGNCNGPVQPRFMDRIKALVKRKPQPPVRDNDPNELPVHTVIVSAFYMDKYEVTKGNWDEVYEWALTNGYAFDNPGLGKARNHPVQTVSWYDCVKWCNARSEKEGLTPCYYLDAGKSKVYRTGQADLGNDKVNWTTNGYRLPTEAEWEKAARGELAGKRFPWGNTISHDQANYCSDTSIRYDVSMTRGHHPKYGKDSRPRTSPVGSFDPNGYGLYDMAGNICEWCWDWYDSVGYRTPGATQGDPHGPATGVQRVLRGGGWGDCATVTRCALRDDFHGVLSPGDSCDSFGFRCVRGL